MQKNEMILFMTKKMFTRCQNLTDTDSRWWHPKASQKNILKIIILKENEYSKKIRTAKTQHLTNFLGIMKIIKTNCLSRGKNK